MISDVQMKLASIKALVSASEFILKLWKWHLMAFEALLWQPISLLSSRALHQFASQRNVHGTSILYDRLSNDTISRQVS